MCTPCMYFMTLHGCGLGTQEHVFLRLEFRASIVSRCCWENCVIIPSKSIQCSISGQIST
eukprot:12110106-Ditylum_brightwellii.AAC.1